MSSQKRLRIFAGPNGSGKSTIINIVRNHGIDMGVYVNADEIKEQFLKHQSLDFANYELTVLANELKEKMSDSTFFSDERSDEVVENVTIESNVMYCKRIDLFDSVSTFTADFIRNKLIGNCPKFTFETVMSHPSKLDFIKKATEQGYKTYLYFVSLEDPELNKNRVKARVQLLGHDVPDDKIESRYYRTMDFLYDALKLVDKAFLFDNSGSRSILFAKYMDSEISIEDTDHVPHWFHTYVLDKIQV